LKRMVPKKYFWSLIVVSLGVVVKSQEEATNPASLNQHALRGLHDAPGMSPCKSDALREALRVMHSSCNAEFVPRCASAAVWTPPDLDQGGHRALSGWHFPQFWGSSEPASKDSDHGNWKEKKKAWKAKHSHWKHHKPESEDSNDKTLADSETTSVNAALNKRSASFSTDNSQPSISAESSHHTSESADTSESFEDDKKASISAEEATKSMSADSAESSNSVDSPETVDAATSTSSDWIYTSEKTEFSDPLGGGMFDASPMMMGGATHMMMQSPMDGAMPMMRNQGGMPMMRLQGAMPMMRPRSAMPMMRQQGTLPGQVLMTRPQMSMGDPVMVLSRNEPPSIHQMTNPEFLSLPLHPSQMPPMPLEYMFGDDRAVSPEVMLQLAHNSWLSQLRQLDSPEVASIVPIPPLPAQLDPKVAERLFKISQGFGFPLRNAMKQQPGDQPVSEEAEETDNHGRRLHMHGYHGWSEDRERSQDHQMWHENGEHHGPEEWEHAAAGPHQDSRDESRDAGWLSLHERPPPPPHGPFGPPGPPGFFPLGFGSFDLDHCMYERLSAGDLSEQCSASIEGVQVLLLMAMTDRMAEEEMAPPPLCPPAAMLFGFVFVLLFLRTVYLNYKLARARPIVQAVEDHPRLKESVNQAIAAAPAAAYRAPDCRTRCIFGFVSLVMAWLLSIALLLVFLFSGGGEAMQEEEDVFFVSFMISLFSVLAVVLPIRIIMLARRQRAREAVRSANGLGNGSSQQPSNGSRGVPGRYIILPNQEQLGAQEVFTGIPVNIPAIETSRVLPQVV